MNTLAKFECNLNELNLFAKKLAKKTKNGDIFLLDGELGVGKTTFTRFFINNIFDIDGSKRPNTIKSPSFPLVINYPLLRYDIYHLDLFRIADKSELSDLNIFENFEKNISIIEWPQIILDNFNIPDYYLLKFELINLNKRLLTVEHSKIKQI